MDELSVGWDHGRILTKGNWNQSVQDRQLFCFLFFLFLFFVFCFLVSGKRECPLGSSLKERELGPNSQFHIETKTHFELGGPLVNSS